LQNSVWKITAPAVSLTKRLVSWVLHICLVLMVERNERMAAPTVDAALVELRLVQVAPSPDRVI